MISSLLGRAKNVHNSNVELWLRYSKLKRWATNWLSSQRASNDLFLKDLVSRKES
jgi:hypothetical protein